LTAAGAIHPSEFSQRRSTFLSHASNDKTLLERGITMSGKTDVIRGRVKEAAGALTGNNRLRIAGRTDQAIGKAEEAAQLVVKKTKAAVKSAASKAKQTGRRAVVKAKASARALRD
jgi:uncharacterized protein YjbJ (UPF0337 family)